MITVTIDGVKYNRVKSDRSCESNDGKQDCAFFSYEDGCTVKDKNITCFNISDNYIFIKAEEESK